MISLLLLVVVVAFAGSKADLDIKYGFRDLKFESAPFPDGTLVESAGEFKCYERPSDALKVGNATLKSLAYCYYKDELQMVSIETEGFLNSRAFLDVLVAAYGEGYQSNQYIERYIWSGSKVGLMYDENAVTSGARVTILSKILSRKMDADEKVAAAAASSSL